MIWLFNQSKELYIENYTLRYIDKHLYNDEIDCNRSICQTSECVKIGYENNILILESKDLN